MRREEGAKGERVGGNVDEWGRKKKEEKIVGVKRE